MRPSDPLVRHYLTNSVVMRLATMSGRGHPSLTPIWFVMAGGRLIASTAATSVAARHIVDEPRVTVLLDGEAAGRSEFVLRLRGIAEVHRGLPPLPAMARIGIRYYLSPRGVRSELSHATLWRLRARYYAQADPVWIGVEPTAAELTPQPRALRAADARQRMSE